MVKLTESEIKKMVKEILPQSEVVEANDLYYFTIDTCDTNLSSSDLKQIKGKFKIVLVYNNGGLSSTVGLRFKIN